MSGIYGPHSLLGSKPCQWMGVEISCLPPIIVLFFAVISAIRILSHEEESLKSKKPILRKLIQERTLNECRIFEGYVPFNVVCHFKFQCEELHQHANQLFVVSNWGKSRRGTLLALQINQPTRCNNFSSLLLDVYVQLNLFRVSSRPSSRAQQLQ